MSLSLASDKYSGPRTIERRGRGMGSWIWVAPGVAQPFPTERVGLLTLDTDEAPATRRGRSWGRSRR